MDEAIKVLKKRWPHLFYQPYRVNVYPQKDMAPMKIKWNASENQISISQGTGNRPTTGASVPETTMLANISRDVKTQLVGQLDMECRKNQFVYHGKYFIFDSILATYSDYKLSARDVYNLRTQCLGFHDDFQSKFLWTDGLYQWCKSYAKSNPEAVSMAFAIMDMNKSEDERLETRLQFKEKMTAQLTKPTFDAVWKVFADVVDYEKSFGDRNGLAYFFIKIIFNMLTPMMFRYIASEEGFGRDETLRKDIIAVYQGLAFELRFNQIDKDVFIWNEAPVQRRRVGKTDEILNRYGWIDEMPPSPPPYHQPGPQAPTSGLPAGYSSLDTPVAGTRRHKRAIGSWGSEQPLRPGPGRLDGDCDIPVLGALVGEDGYAEDRRE